jgi:riboflavin biosynthesis pyrimidine reductase
MVLIGQTTRCGQLLFRRQTMRYLLPLTSAQVDLFEAYSSGVPPPAFGPFVRISMITSLDGATAVGGRSGGLGGPADRTLFALLRSMADVVLVGSGTARIEGYGPVELPEEVQLARKQRGQSPLPPVAVVTQSGNLDFSSKLFQATSPRTIVVAPGSARVEMLARAREVADVLTAGAGTVDLRAALDTLAAEGLRHVLCEGGPTLNLSLAAAGVVNELCATLSPQLAGAVGGVLMGGWLGSGGVWLARTGAGGDRTFRSQPLTQLVKFSLVHVLEEDGYLFVRLRNTRGTGGAGG